MSGYKTMPQQDYYEILGVPREASTEEIRKAYLKLAHKYHPDRTGGDKAAEDKLKEINEAYDTLKNAEKRAQYDRFGRAGEQFAGGAGGFEGFGGFGGFGGAGPGAGGGFESPFEDFFDVLFGRGGAGAGAGARRRAATPGNDLEVRISVTLREAAFGTKKTVKINRMETCSECNGSGAAPGTQPQTCPDCGGTGQVRRAQGFFSITQTCPKCRGAGRIVAKPCARCNGLGKVRVQREISVDLPPGVDTGSRLRVAGEGEPGDGGGPRGDLYIYVEVLPDEIFTREGNDVVVEVPIGFVQAALGTTIRVPTLRGEAELKVPPGTQAGQLFRMRNQGIPDLRGYRQGDQIVRIHVETPSRLTREQRELLQQFQELSDHQAYPLQRRFQEKLKNVRSSE
jgi:molecular chaperone DnaJ